MAFDSAALLATDVPAEAQDPGRPQVSIIIPTYNRSELLKGALDSVAQLAVPDRALLEVIVVDNNSTDRTSAMVLGMQPGYPFPLTYIFEPQPGVSYARNTGIARSQGDVLLFMDDDQEVDPAYVSRALATFARHEADCVGGWVGYKNADRFPSWMRKLILRQGQRDLSPVTRRLGASDGRLAGGNMALTRAALNRIGGFRTDMGRTRMFGRDGEDIELQDRLVAAGGTLIYDPGLRMHHCLRAERLHRRYYLARAFHSGRGEFRLQAETWKPRYVVAGVPLAVVERGLTNLARALRPKRLEEGERFDDLCGVAAQAGKAAEAFTIWAKPLALRTCLRALQLYFRRWPMKAGKTWVWTNIAEKGFAWRSIALKARTRFGALMDLKLPDLIQTYIYFFGVWEPTITRHIERTLKAGDCFIDVGANVGYHTLLAAHCVGPQGKVLSVEASPSIFKAFTANVAHNNLAQVSAFHCAAGAEAGEIAIYLHGADNLGATTTLAELAQARGAAVEARVPLKRLPDIVGRDSLLAARMIKIDVEGAEWPVVQGFADLLPEMRADILVEINRKALAAQGVSAADFIGVFEKAGYKAWRIANVYAGEFYIDPPLPMLTKLDRLDFDQVDVVFRK